MSSSNPIGIDLFRLFSFVAEQKTKKKKKQELTYIADV